MLSITITISPPRLPQPSPPQPSVVGRAAGRAGGAPAPARAVLPLAANSTREIVTRPA